MHLRGLCYLAAVPGAAVFFIADTTKSPTRMATTTAALEPPAPESMETGACMDQSSLSSAVASAFSLGFAFDLGGASPSVSPITP